MTRQADLIRKDLDVLQDHARKDPSTVTTMFELLVNLSAELAEAVDILSSKVDDLQREVDAMKRGQYR